MPETTRDFQSGTNSPSPVAKVLMLGYFDGATDGALQLHGGRAYRFDMPEEGVDSDSPDQRAFALRPLPPDAWDRLVAVIGEHISPTWPHWLPVWRFPDPEIQESVESRVDALLDRAGPVEWEITTRDLVGFATLTARTRARAPALAG